MSANDRFHFWFAPENLRAVFFLEVKEKPSVGIDSVTVSKFEESLDENLKNISRKVLDGTFQFTNYSQLLILKGAGKLPRELCVPTVRDKLVLKALSHVLDDVFGDACKTPQPQKVVDSVYGAIQSGEYSHFVKLDVQRFYSSVNHDMLMRKLRSKIRKHELLALLENAIATPSVPYGQRCRSPRDKGIPEGLPISNRLANLYLNKLDTLCACRHGIVYSRYVDDIVLLGSADDVLTTERWMKSFLGKMDLKLNESKRKNGSLDDTGFEFLGYYFNKGYLSVGSRAKTHIESVLEQYIAKAGRTSISSWEWRLNLKITGCRLTYDGQSFQRYGWLYYYSRQTDCAYLGRLDSLLRKFARRRNISVPTTIKSFKKAYYEIRYHERQSKYIPVINMNMHVDDKRAFLQDKLGINTSGYSDNKIPALFGKAIRREIRDLEQDVGLIS